VASFFKGKKEYINHREDISLCWDSLAAEVQPVTASRFLLATAVGDCPSRVRQPFDYRLNTGWQPSHSDPEDCLCYPKEWGVPFSPWGSVGGFQSGSIALLIQQERRGSQHPAYEGINISREPVSHLAIARVMSGQLLVFLSKVCCHKARLAVMRLVAD